ncbi:MAG: cytochrome P450 [Trichodesmium sp. MAG_R03]|nr:cytochrome P450 [Trichodesmium sp. MAG_R03]
MKQRNLLESHPLPPGNLGLPWLGETLNFLRASNFIDYRRQRYGPIFKTHLLGQPTVIMIGPEANRFILSSHVDYFSQQGWPNTFKFLLGQKALVLQEGSEHRRSRKLIMPTLCGSALASYLATMEQVSLNYLEQWEKLENLTWFPELRRMTFEIASILLVGGKAGKENDRLFKWFCELSQGLFAVPINLKWTAFGKAIHARQQILSYIEQAILERQKAPTQDVLSLLMQVKDETGYGLSQEEIQSQTLALLIGTNSNTASMLVCFCMALAQNPEILDLARAEQYQIEKTFLGSSLSLAQLKQMTYLDQILQEVERCYPPVGAGFRRVIKPFVFNNYVVPSGWNVMYSVIGTHLDSRIYVEPRRFDPDRFSTHRAEHKKINFSLIGFGGGVRNCLGFSFAQTLIKTFAAYLIRYYDWELIPEQNLTLNRIPTAHPRSGLKVKLKKIKAIA